MASTVGRRVVVIFGRGPADTKVMDAETCEEIKHVHRVELVADYKEPSTRAILHMSAKGFEAEAVVTDEVITRPAFEHKIREKLAAIEHERWAHWQRYLHSKCIQNEDGSLCIPADLVGRWERQMNAPYADLSEKEKQSDRNEVDRYWPVIQEWRQGHGW